MARQPFAGDVPVSQLYGRNPNLYAPYGLKGHEGLDFATPIGTELLAPEDATITEVADTGSLGYGKYVAMQNDARGWLLGHMSRQDVRVGQAVKAGQRCGLSGNTGHSTGPHVHLGTWIPGTPRDDGWLGYRDPYDLILDRPALKRVLLQRAHYPNAGGAPGEAKWTPLLVDKIATILAVHGYQPIVVDDFYNRNPPPQVSTECAIFVADHYDASVYAANTGCFADRGIHETFPRAADAFIAGWSALYPQGTGIPLHNERRNANTNQYYAYAQLSEATPGVLIEHGCGATVEQFYNGRLYPKGDDTDYLWNNLDAVALLDARALLAYLATWNPAPVVVIPPSSEVKMLTDQEVLAQIVVPLWAAVGGGVDANGGFTAIARSWVMELRAGRYRGAPISPEIGLPNGGVYQRFEQGVAIWKGGADPANLDVSWKG